MTIYNSNRTLGEIRAKFENLATGKRAPLADDVYVALAAYVYDVPVESVSDLMRHRCKSLAYFIAYSG